MNTIGKGQVKNVEKHDVLGQRDFVYSPFRIAVAKN